MKPFQWKKFFHRRRETGDWSGSFIDYNAKAERMGWLPSAPALKTNPLDVSKQAAAAGMDAKDYVAQALKSGELGNVLYGSR